MKQSSKTYLIISIVFVYTGNLWSQNKLNDAALWPTIALEKKMTSKFSAKLTSRARIAENFTQLNSYYFDFGGYYEVMNNFKISVDYVFAPTRLNNGAYRTIHQYYISLNNKHNLNALWSIKNRLILQHGSNYLFSDNGYKPYSKTNLREKFSISRKINRRNSIYLEDEVMFPFKNGPFEIRRNRLYSGLNHSVTKQLGIDLYFILQSIYHQKMTENSFIYGFTINYQF